VLIIGLSTRPSDQTTPVSVQAQPSLRWDGGPEETSVATASGSLPAAAGPDESRIAASIAVSGTPSAGALDESRIAASIAGR
jgi:hypothetical protein